MIVSVASVEAQRPASQKRGTGEIGAFVGSGRFNRYAYVSNNPMGYVDPDGGERAQIILDQDNMALLRGEMTRSEFTSRRQAAGVGAVVAAPLAFGFMGASSALAGGFTDIGGTYFHLEYQEY